MKGGDKKKKKRIQDGKGGKERTRERNKYGNEGKNRTRERRKETRTQWEERKGKVGRIKAGLKDEEKVGRIKGRL